VTEFGNEIFNDCKDLTVIKVDKYSEAHAYFNADERMTFTNNKPKQTKEQWIASSKYTILEDGILYIGHDKTKTEYGQYKDNAAITDIRFPETLKTIGHLSFMNDSGLNRIVIPGTVEVISDWAFAKCANLEEVVIEEGVAEIRDCAFYDCPKLKSIAVPKSVRKITNENSMFWGNNDSKIFRCYAGSEAYRLAKKNGYKIDILGIDEQNTDSITELVFSANETIKPIDVECPNLQIIKLGHDVRKISSESFRNYAVSQIDINNEITDIGRNAFHDKTNLRVKRNTYGDKWCKDNGYYLCGVLADLNTYTKDKSKEIKADFTRILCDDTPYVEWTSYKFKIQEPLKLEEVDDKLVLTSFMLYPCKNVTVTDQDGKVLIKNKTIYPLTRTVLCDFDFLTDNVEIYSLTSDDKLYQIFKSMPIDWTVTFDTTIRKTESLTKGMYHLKMNPVLCREWIATICNHAYVIASDEFEELNYKYVEKKLLVTNKETTKFLTKEEMDKLLLKTRKHTFQLGHCDGGGLGDLGGSGLWLISGWFCNLGKSGGVFYHEFSHNMGWNHADGNMCNSGAANGYAKTEWPSVGSSIFQEFFKAGELPYTDLNIFNTNFFSFNELHRPDPGFDIVKNGVLYIGERMPRIDSHKKQTDFTKVVISPSVEVIKGSAFYDTNLSEINIPPNVTNIGNESFLGCLSLKNIEIPDNVKKVGDGAFENCTSLTKVKIGSGIRQLSKKMFKNSALTEVTIPKNIKFIDNEAFNNCRNLTKVVIEDGVRKIGDNAFGGTALTEIIIPPSVTMIGKNITSKNVVWNVKEGSFAHTFAIENKFLVGTLADKGKKILAE
ncbi:MAG: leucine-rich repeat domain-containing protein, partial [Spirochaetales bacterium]|nr:leucine-rich repeat domain-containing protein [Spirochaetales bacterium]